MQVARVGHCMVKKDGIVYALGGNGIHCEMYNVKADRWKPMKSFLRHEIYNASACVMNEKIYVFGQSHGLS